MGLLKKVIAKIASMGSKGGTHEHHAGEFSTGGRPTGRVASRAPGSAARKSSSSDKTRSAGHALRSAQSLRKAQISLKNSKTAKTASERERHAREATRHSENASRHASAVTSTSHAAVAESLRRRAEQVRTAARTDTKSASRSTVDRAARVKSKSGVTVRSGAERKHASKTDRVKTERPSAPIGPFGASVLFKRKK